MTNVAKTTKKTRLSMKALKGKIQLRGLAVVDRRTSGARHLIAWRDELVTALGGSENVSPQRAALIELCVRQKAVLDHIDAFLLEMPTLINVRQKKLVPLVEQRTRLADHLARLLGQIGLERVPKPVPSLAEYLAQTENEPAQETDPAEKEQVSEDDTADDG